MSLAQQEVDTIVDCLRRNILYQTPEIIMGESDETHPRAVVMRMRPDDYYTVFELIKKAGGWDLTLEQKESMGRRSIHELHSALSVGALEFEELDAGTLMWIIEKTEHDATYKLLHDVAESELAARSGAH